MSPLELSKRLNNIASAVDASRFPDRSLVVKELRRLMASIDSDLVVNKVELHGPYSSFPDFWVHGLFRGEPFVRQVAVDLGSRDMETKHISGFDFEVPHSSFDPWQIDEPMLNEIYGSQAYADAVAKYPHDEYR